MAGDAWGRVFTFPIPTYNITEAFDWEHPNATLLFEMTAKHGPPHFQNFLNSELQPHMVVDAAASSWTCASCSKGNGTLFGPAEQTASVGVTLPELRAPGAPAPR